VNTDRSQAIVGFSRENPQITANLALKLDNPFAAVTLTALDDRPIARSEKLLLTTTARVANSGMQWNAARKSLEKWGAPPPLIEPVTGVILLENLAAATAVTAQPLDGTGRPTSRAIEASKTDQGWELNLGDTVTTWHVLTVSH
jgi:hypothetical protein